MRFNRRRFILAAILVIGVAAFAAFAVLNVANAPAASGVEVADCLQADGGACIRFPLVTGTNLLGETLNLPEDFAPLTLVLMSFDEAQTARTAAWLPLAQELAEQHPTFAYYNVPTLKSVNALVRVAITGGMVLAVPQEVHAVTVMLFLEEKQLFLDALGIPDIDQPQAFLLNDAGEVIWRMRGDYSDEAAASLRTAGESS
jgi:hypothetical protein